MDMENHLTIAYMMNRMETGLVGDDRGLGLIIAAVAAIQP